MVMKEWFYINNINETDSPALVIYPKRVSKNIELAKEMIGDAARLRPHVKTSKIAEVCTMMMEAGITKFKCATIAEAEMLAQIKAPDVLLAYQPVGPKVLRLIALIKMYPQTRFSCLVDNAEIAWQLAGLCEENKITLPVFIDINVGMNRTGILPDKAFLLLQIIKDWQALYIKGLHVYDGHIHDKDFTLRKQKSDAAFADVEALLQQASGLFTHLLKIITGGTPTFPVHVQRANVECSPGTFVFWDWGYKHGLPDEPFEYAALLITRIISVINEQTICVDLGHKSVAAENPLPRVHLLNALDAIPVSQSEEHLVLQVPVGNEYKAGDVLYGVPVHICPTVALYDVAHTVINNKITGSWEVIARNRKITV